ncbi:MAG TPA: alcohol dehydrogenase catalytic domain-containing protein [Candidatus Brocadiia bacterium]|nr:alcohol dehydrogenase catalytic domain-containing protein [Candidatus Brocadiia bacterium]
MKAIMLNGGPALRDDCPEPVPGEGEALVRVTLAGICRTDIELAKGYMNFRGIPGHEFAGVVESCESRPELAGRRVVGEINCPCNSCPTCMAGRGNHCPNRTVLGISGRDGAFAECLTLPAANLHEIPDNVPDERAVFTEPLAAAFEVLKQDAVRPSDSVLVIGDGKLGLLVAQVCSLACADVSLLGRHRERALTLAGKGVRCFFGDDLPAVQYDVVIECSGNPDAMANALPLCRPGGKLVLKTTVAGNHAVNLTVAVVNEITIIGSRCGPFEPALRALERGAIDTDALIEDTYPLELGVSALRKASEGGRLKMLLRV